jgi:hypothetical protein
MVFLQNKNYNGGGTAVKCYVIGENVHKQKPIFYGTSKIDEQRPPKKLVIFQRILYQSWWEEGR